MKGLYQTMTVMGRVGERDARGGSFDLHLLNGDTLTAHVPPTTSWEVLRNVADNSRDRVPEPDSDSLGSELGVDGGDAAGRNIVKYLDRDRLVVAIGIITMEPESVRFDVRRIVLMHSDPTRYGFEDTHWWLQQIGTLFEQWLDVLFGETREFTPNDFAERYRTHLDFLGGETSDVAQECATMSRFLYGVSSAYLLTGNQRALSAATACASHLISSFAIVSHDRRYCFWKFGRRPEGRSTRDVVPSENWDDRGSYALYEQIYALSGLAQYFRITQDTRVLGYIELTIAAFQDFFRDVARDGDSAFRGRGGYFSHLDPVTMRPDSSSLNLGNGYDNVCKKNWNSIGDHIPAYLVNVLLALDPLVSTRDGHWKELRNVCREILDDCVTNILDRFFTSDSPFVNERFTADWKQDLGWGWQQNRAIVGHNLKISWNLTRCGHYYASLANTFRSDGFQQQAQHYAERSRRCYDQASELADRMDALGVDQIRGGVWDAVERKANERGGHDFAWGSTKDFWQQEQAILAYYVLHGVRQQTPERAARYLELARACTAFWSLFFVDQDHRRVFFRTDESGMPVVEGQYGVQSGHAIAGYHAFELNYLAHLYIRTYVSKRTDDNFALTFCPVDTGATPTLNVLPDFLPPGSVRIQSLRVNGIDQDFRDDVLHIDVSRYPNGSRIEVELRPVRSDADTSEAIDQSRPTSTRLSGR